MRFGKRYFFVLSFLALVFAPRGSVLSSEGDASGMISGKVINGTNKRAVSGVELTLLKGLQGQEPEELRKTTTGAEGEFSFRNIDRGQGLNYILKVVYRDVEYYSPVIVLNKEKREIPLDMTVYETTDSPEKVSVKIHHVLVEPTEEALSIRELMIVENEDNRTYVGSREVEPGKKETLRISLPSEAQGLQLLKGLMSCCIVKMQDGFSDTMDIKPGRKVLSFAYRVPYKASTFDLDKKINLKTISLDFFIPEQGIRVEGKNIKYAGVMGESGKRFLHFTGKNLADGSLVTLGFKGLPWKHAFFKGLMPALALAFFGIGLIYPLVRHRRKARSVKVENTGNEDWEKAMLQRERENLLLAIAELDNLLHSGEISQERHREKRRLLKERAVKITKLLQG